MSSDAPSFTLKRGDSGLMLRINSLYRKRKLSIIPVSLNLPIWANGHNPLFLLIILLQLLLLNFPLLPLDLSYSLCFHSPHLLTHAIQHQQFSLAKSHCHNRENSSENCVSFNSGFYGGNHTDQSSYVC